jgi:hypothetical protein
MTHTKRDQRDQQDQGHQQRAQLARFAALLGAVAVLTLSTSACETEGYCWEGCVDGISTGGGAAGAAGKSGAAGAAGTVDVGGSAGSFNFAGNAGASGANAGNAGAAGAACKDTQGDPNNCGSCGNVCVIPGAFPKCVAGKCAIDTCAPGRSDLDGNESNGCEYACVPSDDAEVCDNKDNNCNGQVDEGFDLQTDINNCGVCGVVCDLANANSACVAGACVVQTCKDGFGDADKLAADGCEYICPVNPPTAEVCDDIDNDCDGEVNNGNPGGGVSCDDSCPSGDCKGECGKGVTLCAGTQIVCVAGQGPQLEICDGKDNDCDGVDDNGFDKTSDPLNCGACGNVCTGDHAVGGCVNGACVIATCLPGFRNIDNATENGCEYECPQTPPGVEVCNGVDDDCNGIVDDPDLIAPSKPQDTFCNTRVNTPCAGATVTCQGTAGWRCGYGAGAEVDANGDLLGTETKCDGQDGNCNGQIDETFGDLGTGCDNGLLGACRDAGVRKCDPSDDSATFCDFSLLPDPVPGAPSAEVCNAIDDDCNGQEDDGLTFDMVEITVAGKKVLVDRYEASRPDATGTSIGTNEDRSCVRGGVLPWTQANYAEALAACTATGRRLCTAAELRTACEGGTGAIYPYGNTYDGATCNGLNNDGVPGGLDDNTLLPTGSEAMCKTPSNEIYDLSGNAAEWTSTQTGTTTGSPALPINQLSGGSFLSPELGTRCAFDLARLSTNAILESVGFRCCKDP